MKQTSGLFFIICILFSPAMLLQASENNAQILPKIQKDAETSRQTKTHIATGTLAFATAYMITGLGQSLGDYAVKNDFHIWLGKQCGFAEQDSYSLAFCTRSTPYALSCLIGLYAIYKAPILTDKYLLKTDAERSLKRSIKTFLARILIPWPFGIWFSEKNYHDELNQGKEDISEMQISPVDDSVIEKIPNVDL